MAPPRINYDLKAVAPCPSCPVYGDSFCAHLLQSTVDDATRSWGAGGTERLVGPRKLILRPGEVVGGIPVLCDGWAASRVTAPNGNRQILGILLPGDVLSSGLLFESECTSAVEAITDVRYRVWPRPQFKAALLASPDLFQRLSRIWVNELAQKDRLILDLGQLGAEVRIARLFLDLFERLSERGLTRDLVIDFPLRHHQIADLTGLSPTHVSKIVAEYRRSGLIEMAGRSLAIRDMAALRRTADMPERRV